MPIDDNGIAQVIPRAVWLKHDSVKGYWSFKVEVNDTVSFIAIIYDGESTSVTEIPMHSAIVKEAIANVNLVTVTVYRFEVVIPRMPI